MVIQLLHQMTCQTVFVGHVTVTASDDMSDCVCWTCVVTVTAPDDMSDCLLDMCGDTVTAPDDMSG